METSISLYGLHEEDYGIVGYGFKCPYCAYPNEFIDQEEEYHECDKCKKIVRVEAIPYEPYRGSASYY